MGPVRNLVCCCCGDRCRGRQWWNRDTGFGVCVRCWQQNPDERLYGKPGVHHSIDEAGRRDQ